jgi:hypothetical protein
MICETVVICVFAEEMKKNRAKVFFARFYAALPPF